MVEQPVSAFVDMLQLPDTLSKLVVNQNSSINHAPGGSIVNEYHNETHLLMYDPSSDVALVIKEGT